uniref:PiggyBac transposable element-derived protein domain-containing protein n=1 Tax=Clastoptera arizonana TaxID=38151 RepID=A0A1B6DPN4_9HEMI
MDNLNSSEIKMELFNDSGESSDSDIGAEDIPSDYLLLDYSSGSGEEFVYDFDEPETSDREDISNYDSHTMNNTPPNNIPPHDPWIRVYPPEPEIDIGPNFKVSHPGPRNVPPRNSPPLAYALLFFTDDFWTTIVNETNAYAHKILANKRDSPSMKRFSRIKKWVDVSINEMKKFFTILINMGLNVESQKPRRSFWDTRRSQHNPFFSQTMNVNRFESILSNFYLTSKKLVCKDQPGYDPWIKVRYFLDHFNSVFKKFFHPWQNISIDESLIGMKNRCPFIMYMPNKKHKQYGIKKFECCDSLTNYVYHIELYSGKDYTTVAGVDIPFTERVILEVMEKSSLIDKGHHLFTDNFYTKVPLATKLFNRNTYLSGIINKRSTFLPETVMKAKLPPKESLYFRQGNVLIINFRQAITRKPVFLISTATHAEDIMVWSKKSKVVGVKPVVINKYNQFIGGVNVSDKQAYHNSCNRRTSKYWKKIFFNVIDIALFNAFVLYKLNTDKPISRRDFIISIVESLAPTEEVPSHGPGTIGDGSHKLEKLPNKHERKCEICKPLKKRARSSYWCPGCNCGIHRECFHKLEHFWKPSRRRAPNCRSEPD